MNYSCKLIFEYVIYFANKNVFIKKFTTKCVLLCFTSKEDASPLKGASQHTLL